MIEYNAAPTIGRVADRAVLSELKIVGVVLLVAGKAGLLHVFEHAIDVTIKASSGCVLARQGKTGQGMVEISQVPPFRRMAVSAVRSVPAFMLVLNLVAAVAVLGGLFEGLVCMAGFAGHLQMSAGQWEFSTGMIEFGPFPLFGVMAGAAVFTKLPVMIVIRGMAGVTGSSGILQILR